MSGSEITFGSVVVARSNDERPSEMELSLRSQCQKLLVVEKKKLNGAHLMIQKSPAIPMCLAVRVYYPEDVKLLDERLSKAMKPSNEKDIDRLSELLHGSKANPTGNQLKERDFDGLKAFLDKFQSTVVICVLPEGSMAYFDQPTSWVNFVQHTMGNRNGKTSWVHFVPDAGSAFTTLTSIVEALHPRKKELKAAYFETHNREFFVPDESASFHEPNDAAEFAAATLEVWARAYGLPEGEERVLMTFLNTLGAIGTATDAELQGLPVERKTRAKLHQFFRSEEWINDVSSTRNPRENLGSSNVRSGNSLANSSKIDQPSPLTRQMHPHMGPPGGTNHPQTGTRTREIHYAGREHHQGQSMTQYASEWIAVEDFEYHQRSATGGMLRQAPSMPNGNGMYYALPMPMPMAVTPCGAGWPLLHPAHEPTQMTYGTQPRPMIPHRRPYQGHSPFSFTQESYGEFQGAAVATNQRHDRGAPPHFPLMHQGGLPQPGQPHQPQHRQQQSTMPSQQPTPFTKNVWPTRDFH